MSNREQEQVGGWSNPNKPWSSPNGWGMVGNRAEIDPRTAIYADELSAIRSVIKRELTEQKPPTRLSKIKMNRAKLKEAVKNVSVEGEKIKAIKKTLLGNIPKLQDFIKSHDYYSLDHTTTYFTPKKTDLGTKFKEALTYLTPYEETRTYTAHNIEVQQGVYALYKEEGHPNAESYKPAKVGDSYKVKGYKITDYDKFVEEVKKSATPADIWAITDPTEGSDDLARVNPVDLEISKFAMELGLEKWGLISFRQETYTDEKTGETHTASYVGMTTMPPKEGAITIDIRQSDRYLHEIIKWALVRLKRATDAYTIGESSEVSNLINGEKHSFIVRDTNMSLYEAMESAIFNLSPSNEKDIKDFNTIFQKYRTTEELEKASGLHLSIPEQKVMPFLNAGNDYQQFQRYMITQIPVFYDLIFALQEYKRLYPNNGGWVNIKDLAKLIPRFEKDIEVKGSLRTRYRNLIADSFNLLKLFDLPRQKEVKKNGNKIYKYYKVVEVSEIEIDKRGNTVALKLDFSQDYYALYSENVAVVGDGIRELDDPQIKALGMRISDYYVCNARTTTKTTKGEPLKKKASELAKWAGLSGNEKNPQRKYGRLAKMLNALAENGKIVGRWENTENHEPKIRGYGKGIGNIIIAVYPSENIQNSLTTKAQRKGSRKLKTADQKDYLRKLKDFDKGYRDRNTEAERLGVSYRTLIDMLGGIEPITDEVMDIVEDEIGDD